MGIYEVLPFLNGTLWVGGIKPPAEIVEDNLKQSGVDADFGRNEAVHLQAALVDDIMPVGHCGFHADIMGVSKPNLKQALRRY
ncbi:MAG: hypothetical protein SFY92_00555 [Verrucomicrobiae bacterium]|nr:hypothetical protein [Verrucomicrobiae bacterium]